MSDYTRRFDLPADDTLDIREILSQVYNSLQQKGYNPINQIVGYILSEDPTYITNFNNARTLIRKLDRGRAVAGTGPLLSGRLIELSQRNQGRPQKDGPV